METKETDILIIGSGVVAAALSQKILNKDPNKHILILEASSNVKMRDFALFQNFVANNMNPASLPYNGFYDLAYPTREDPNGENQSLGNNVVTLQGGRLMMYGGSTVHWGGWAFRRKPEDFYLYSNTGIGTDWPINYDTLEPYYCEAENYIGVSGDSKDPVTPRSKPYPYAEFPYTLEDGTHIDAFEKLKISYSHLPIARHGISETDSSHAPCQTTGTCKYCPFGARYVAANYLDDIKAYDNYPNLDIRQNVIVNEVTMTSKSKASGAKCFDKTTGVTFNVKAKTVIVAAGAIESPKLLLNSKSNYWKNGLGNDHDIVGRNFLTHPYFILQANLPKNPLKLQPEMGFPTLVTRYFDSKEEQKKGKYVFINPNTSPGVNLASWMQQGKSKKEIDALVSASPTNPLAIQIQGMVEVFPEHTNYVKPLDKLNHLGLQQTIVHYDKAPGFDARMKEITDKAREIFSAMGAVNIENTLQAPISWRADHASCTMRMADVPEKGVIDKDLKIFGVDNVYVCSNGSFPNLGAVNPTLTLTALAIRLADKLSAK